jgi:hypothetical protein
METRDLTQVIQGANFLHIPTLLFVLRITLPKLSLIILNIARNLGTSKISAMILGKSPEQIREIFNIKEESTREMQAQVRVYPTRALGRFSIRSERDIAGRQHRRSVPVVQVIGTQHFCPFVSVYMTCI